MTSCTRAEVKAIRRDLRVKRCSEHVLGITALVGYLGGPMLLGLAAAIGWSVQPWSSLVGAIAVLTMLAGLKATIMLTDLPARPHLEVIRRMRNDLERAGELDGPNGPTWCAALASAENRINEPYPPGNALGHGDETYDASTRRRIRDMERAVCRNPLAFVLDGAPGIEEYVAHQRERAVLAKAEAEVARAFPRTLEEAVAASDDPRAEQIAAVLTRRAREDTLPRDLAQLLIHTPHLALTDPLVETFRELRGASVA